MSQILYTQRETHISGQHFWVKYEFEYSKLKKNTAGVPQGSVLGPIVYLLYIRDIPLYEGTVMMTTFADDMPIMATGSNVEDTTYRLQNAVNNCTKKWRVKLNKTNIS